MISGIRHVMHLNSIKGNIILSLIAVGSFTLLLTGSGFWFYHTMESDDRVLTEQLEPAKQLVQSINASVNSATLSLHAYLDTGKDKYRNDWEGTWNQKISPQIKVLQNTHRYTVNESKLEYLNKLNKNITRIREQQHEMMSILKSRNLTEAQNSRSESHDALRLYLRQDHLPLLQEFERNVEIAFLSLQEQSLAIRDNQQEKRKLLKFISIAITLLCILAVAALSYFLNVQIIRSLYHIKLAVKELSKGNLPQQLRQSQNETSHITSELAQLTSNLRNVQQFALKVGEGKFDDEINVFNNSGELGSSLASMRESLLQVAQGDKQRNWVNEGFARFADILRNNNNSIAELCDITISSLVKYVEANQGAIFLVKNSPEHEMEVLKMASCYAYDRKKYIDKEIFKGEGLCGQAWQENDTLLVNDVPQNYVQIRSGLGGTTPNALLAVPLVAGESTQGVLELASFHQFEEYQIEFIQKIADNLASAIATAHNHEKTQQLLMEFQIITEQMRAQEEEMRQNMEELEATQEEMGRAQQEIARKEFNLNSVINNTQDTIFAIDQEYRITVVNKVLSDKYKKMGIALETGTLISSVLPRSAWDKWKLRYDRALAGEQYSIIEESTALEGSRYSQTYHNPILDDNGAVIGVSVVSRDVTDTVLAQNEAERKRSTLNSLIDNTDDTYFAIDLDYKILIANKTLKDRFATSNISLHEGENIFDKLPKDQHPMWKERYDRALAGESFVLTTERQVKDITLTIEVHHHPILNHEGAVIGASVVSKDITRWKKAIEEKEAHEKELLKLKQLVGLEASPEEQVLKKAGKK